MSFKCQIFRKRLTVFNNVLELSCDVGIIILCCFIIATVLPSDIKCAKLPNPQIRLLINDEDLLHEKTSRHEAAAAAAAAEAASAHHADNSGEHFNLYRSELKRLSYETIHRILRDENEPSYRREETELRYYQKRSPPAYEDVGHQLNKRSTIDKETQQQENIALNYSKRNLQEFVITDQLAKELAPASSLDLSDNHLCSLNLTFSNHLQSLNLSNNSFTAIPITGKSHLKTLNLNRNNIISPSSLESNIYLRQLYLSNNRLENILPLNLSLLKNLETLDISCNSLKNLETSFFPERMHNLKHLNMAHNQLGAIYRETFYNLLSLNTLLLGHNNITDIDYETFLALPNLQYLDLSYNALKGKSIRALQGITGLVALNIAYNPELGPYMQEFVASWSLKELDASGTGLCQIPAALAQSVRSLKLTHNWLKVINCGDLDSYPLLQYLDLSHSHIEEIEDDALGRLEILEILMLDHNNLKKIPQSLPVSLEHLFLQYNNIMDIQSQSFQGLTSLKTLDLSNNKLLYLPDITLPKLQTLNLQSSEIRGISQGIIHTLPRLNELLLEDNPIKCSDLLGIAEWASTCRLRTNKDEEVMEDSENDEGSEGGNERGKNLKDNFMKMYNFYEKFGGEQCPRNSSLNKLIPQPKCAMDKKINQSNLQLSLPKKITLERSLEVENFNLNSIMDEAIPLPSKKAGQQAIASNKILATSAGEVDVKAITTNEMPVPIILEMKENGKEEENEMPRTTTTTAGTPTTWQSTLASVDKPQEHSNSTNASKEFSEMAKTLIATNAAGENATGQDREEQTIEDQRNSNGEMNSSTTETMGEFSLQQQQKQQQQHIIVGATQTLQTTSLPTANLPEILKENMKEKTGKEIAQGNLALAADRMTDEILGATTPTNPPKTTSAMAINLTKSQAITSGMADTSKENGEREMTSTSTTTTQPFTPPTLATRIANVKLNKEQQEIKTEIGLTKKIKSLESSTTQEPVVATTRTTTSTTTTPTPTTIKGLSPPKMTLTSSATTQTDIYANINTQSNEQRRIDVTTSSSVAENTAEAKQQLKEDSITTTAQQLSSKPPLTMAKDKDLASNNTIITAAAAATHSNNNFSNNNNNDMDTDAQDDNNKMSSVLEITTTITPRNNVQQSTATSQQHHSWSSTTTSPTPTTHVYQTIRTEVENSSMTVTASPSAVPSLDGNDVNDKCLQSNANGCADQRPQRQDDKSNVIGKTPTNQTSHEPEEYDVETTTTAAATTMSTTSSKAVVVATTTATPVVHKHEPLQLHVKDRHLIGTPLLMHKGDNLMVATDELIKANPQDSGKRSTGTTKTTTTSTPPSTTTYGMASTAAAAAATGPQTALPAEAKTMKTILAKSQHSTKPFKKNHDDDDNVNDMLSLRHHPQHEPFEHKGETIKVKDYSLYAKKSNNADMAKTKKPSLIMKKMTIVTKQHEVVIADSPASATTSTTTISPLPDATNSAEMVNPLNERQFSERHFQELRPQHNNMAKHSTVNTPVNGNRQQAHHLMHEPQTFQHEHELLMQQILHDEQQQQQQHEKLSQSEQWSDLRKANNKDNHPGLILLVSSGLFVVLLLGLMHVYRCDVPWRRSSPAHHLRPHQRHNASLDDDVHSFLSYNEGMQKWHHSTRLEAPYSSPLHNLHVRELQQTSATEKPATIKTSSSYAETMPAATNRHHILPRSNSQSSSTTTRTTSPSSSAMLDDETFYIEMTPPAGQLAQALHSELLPMELLNLAQTKTSDIKETTVGDLQTSLQDDCVVLTSSRGQHIAPPYKASSSITMGTTTASSSSHRDLLISSTPLASSAAAAAASSSAAAASNSQKPLYNSRKFGLW